MRLVHDDQVVCAVIELFQQGVVARQLVHARYQQRMIVQRALADGPVGGRLPSAWAWRMSTSTPCGTRWP